VVAVSLDFALNVQSRSTAPSGGAGFAAA
jgi:hypothetical protein